jgi:GWxTD domain-containing protein
MRGKTAFNQTFIMGRNKFDHTMHTAKGSLYFLYTFRCFIFWCLTAVQPLQAIDAGITHIIYATPDRPYVQVSLEIAGESIAYKPVDSLYNQAVVEVTILIKSGDNVVNFEKYTLKSPAVRFPQSLLDIKRLALSEVGNYTIEVVIQDMQSEKNRFVYQKPLTVNVGTGLYLSEVELLRTFRRDDSESLFSKNGFYMEPLPYQFYDRAARTLAFYAEVYHSAAVVAANETYLVRYFIENEQVVGNSRLVGAGSQRKKASAIDAILVQMDISPLASGNYTLTLELRNNANELLVLRKVSFQRSNPFLAEPVITDSLLSKQFVQDLDSSTLRYSLRAISAVVPGADDTEMLKNILKNGNMKSMRFFLFRHFVRQNPNQPEVAYQQYMETAKAVEKRFHSGFRYGFETDRGRTFLKYGKPDDLVHVEDDPNAPPYEIWVYYNFPVTRQKNVKFMFYNPTLAGEDYIILHSNARGEINNPRWERELYRRGAGEQYDGDNYHDATRMQRNNNRNARIFFDDF